MSSIRELAIQDLIAKINVGLPIAGPPAIPLFKRTWTWAITPPMCPFGSVYILDPQDQIADQARHATTRWGALLANQVVLGAQVTFKGDGVIATDTAIDPILVHIHKRTVGQSKAQFYRDVELIGSSFKPAQADYPFCRATMYLRVLYQTQIKDPESWANTA
jgi:hypothetical protein